jgi:TPR repeat protein
MARLTLFALSLSALMACSTAQVAGAAGAGLSEKERYAQAEALRLGSAGAADAEGALDLMAALAQDGNSRAQARLAYYYLKGIGGPVDQEAAALWYQAAIAGGRDSARVSYAKLLAAKGDTAEALLQLDLAVEAGLSKAQVLRASYHYQGRFGDLSDRAFGQAALTELAQAGDMAAIQVVLRAVHEGADFEVDAAGLTQQLLGFARSDQAKAGGKAAETLLRVWRGQAGADMLALRTEMLAHPSLRARARAEDGLMLAHDSEDARAFRTAAQQIVAQASGADFERALYVTSRLDQNAYVHVLQEELRSRGYAVGPTTGVFNTRTLWAVVAFCKDTGIQPQCRLGPMRARVIKTIVGELAAMPPQA